MARIDTFGHFLTDVATAIRNKTGKSETIACEDFDTEIESISGGGGQKNRLPDEYQEVEYVQSSGTQYFITDYYANGNSCYDFQFSDGITSGVIFGAYNTGWTTGSGFYHNNTTSQREYFHYYANTMTALDGSYTKQFTLSSEKGVLYSNGAVISSVSDKTFTLSYPLYILAGNWYGSRAEQPISCKLYYFKIHEGGINIHEFIPCYRKSDNVIGMYDLVEDEFITNAGTGTFEKGPDHDTPIANLQDKEITITENTTTEITADSDYDGLGTVSVITNVSGGSTIPIFSTTEIEVGTWIDNKPLYMKTITGTITTNSSGGFDQLAISTNISDALDLIFLGENSFFMTTVGDSYPVNYLYTNSSGSTTSLVKTRPTKVDKTILTLCYGSLFPANSTITYTFNVFYVKTNDSVVSNLSTSLGNNFSTTEHLAGTDDNGINIYEKTVAITTTGYQNNKPINKTITHNISDIDKVWITNGSFMYSSGSSKRETYPVNYFNHYSSTYRQVSHVKANKTQIELFVGDWQMNAGTIYHYITLRYTKSTA